MGVCPTSLGWLFIWEEKARYSSVIQICLFLIFPGPCSPVTHVIISKWMNTFVHTHTRELRAPCSLLQVSTLSSAGRNGEPYPPEEQKHHLHEVGSVPWARRTFGLMQKSQLGEHELEALVKLPDDLVSLLLLPFHASALGISA